MDINSTANTQSPNINEDSLSDVDVDLDDLESNPGASYQPLSPAPEEETRPITEEDVFANLNLDSTMGVSFTAANLKILQQQLSQPLEARSQPVTEETIFAAFDAHLAINASTPSNTTTQPTEQNSPASSASTPATDEDSLSDIDVDLNDLESIPDDFVIPMLTENGTPISDSDSDATPNTTNNESSRPQTPEENVRNLIIQVQGDDADIRMEDDFFPTPSNHTPLADATVTSAYRNQNAGVVRTRGMVHRRRQLATIRLAVQQLAERARGNDMTSVWPRSQTNQENVAPDWEEAETEQQRRERIWRAERDEMIVSGVEEVEGELDREERVLREERADLERRVRRNSWRESRWAPYAESLSLSWMRHLR